MIEIINFKENLDYIILLSGQDYPLKNNDYIAKFLNKNYGKEFIEFEPLPRKKWIEGGLNRINKYHFMDIRNRYLKYSLKIISNYLPNRKIPNNIKFFGGSLWWSLTLDCVKYVIDFVSKNHEFVKLRTNYLPRKFDINYDSKLLDLIDNKILKGN